MVQTNWSAGHLRHVVPRPQACHDSFVCVKWLIQSTWTAGTWGQSDAWQCCRSWRHCVHVLHSAWASALARSCACVYWSMCLPVFICIFCALPISSANRVRSSTWDTDLSSSDAAVSPVDEPTEAAAAATVTSSTLLRAAVIMLVIFSSSCFLARRIASTTACDLWTCTRVGERNASSTRESTRESERKKEQKRRANVRGRKTEKEKKKEKEKEHTHMRAKKQVCVYTPIQGKII